MTLTNVVTKEKRCATCGCRLLIKCKVCDGNGVVGQTITDGVISIPPRPCSHCAGHKVVLQEPVHEPTAEDL